MLDGSQEFLIVRGFRVVHGAQGALHRAWSRLDHHGFRVACGPTCLTAHAVVRFGRTEVDVDVLPRRPRDALRIMQRLLQLHVWYTWLVHCEWHTL